MKGQILSRIQSYQNIPINATSSAPRLPNNKSNKLINEAKFMKIVGNNDKESPSQTVKLLSPPTKIPSHRFFLSTYGKKLFANQSTAGKEQKRSMNYDLKTIQKQKINQIKNYRLPKRQSQKCFQYRTLAKDLQKQYENQPNRSNTITTTSYNKAPLNSQKQIQLPHQTVQVQKDINRVGRRRQVIRIYNKVTGSKSGNLCVGSEQNIRHYQQTQEHKDPELQTHSKTTQLLMKTSNPYNAYGKIEKKTSYLNVSNKKVSILSPLKNLPKSFNRIPTTLMTQQNDVSIQIAEQELQKQTNKSIKQQQSDLQFGCSQIKEMIIENDSSFLDNDQKRILTQLQQTSKKEECKKKIWKKLPSDFLKY